MAALARTLLVVLALGTHLAAEDHAGVSLPPVQISSPPVHRFWDHKNLLLFSGVAAFRGLDYASTRNFQARGRQEILLPDDVVNNSAGFASLEAAGVATSVGIAYILHRSGHHKLERWLSIGHIAVTGFGAARNYSPGIEAPVRAFLGSQIVLRCWGLRLEAQTPSGPVHTTTRL